MTDTFQPVDPRLLARLESLRGRLKRLAWTHGFATWFASAAALLLGSFYLDRFLAPPHAMRLLVAPAVWGSIGFGFYWWVIRRARVAITHDDAALLVERAYPELGERLISAVQLSRNASGASPQLVEVAIREGEEATRSLDFTKALKPAPARWRALLAIIALGACAALVATQGSDVKVFLKRLAGFAEEFPQRTDLDIELPSKSSNVKVKRDGNQILAKIAKGADLAVRVTAKGDAPDLVELHTSEGQVIPLSRIPPNEYLGRFHNVRTSFSFYATGGDDRDEKPSVSVETITAPSLSKIRVSVKPPEYSAQPAFERESGSFEALMGSVATISIETLTPVRRAILRFRGSEEELAFVSSEPTGDGPLTQASHYTVSLNVEKNTRYSVELEDAEGLRNPDPGSYSIVALNDRAPDVKLQVPARTEIDVAPNGLLAIQARATDDFGVASMKLRYRVNGKDAFTDIVLPRTAITPATNSPKPESAPAPLILNDKQSARAVVSRARIDLAQIRIPRAKDEKPAPADPTNGGDTRALTERDSLEIYVESLDGKNPKPGVGESFHVRATVLPQADILKRITERFSRAKDTVQSLLEMQNERRRRVNELMEAFDRPSISSVLVGQNRISIDSRALTREFFEGLESACGNRLDPIAEAAFAELERIRGDVPAALEDPYAPEVAQALVSAIRSGSLGSPQQLSELAEMLHEAFVISANASPEAAKALDAALLAVDGKTSREALEKARAHQDASIQSLEKLLGMLSKWANFQDVVSGWKELLDQQKSLRSKTRERAQPGNSQR